MDISSIALGNSRQHLVNLVFPKVQIVSDMSNRDLMEQVKQLVAFQVKRFDDLSMNWFLV